MLVENSDANSLVAIDRNRLARGHRTESARDRPYDRALLQHAEWHVLRQLFIRTAAFHERRNRVASANHRLPMESRRRPGKPDPRQQIADAEIVLVQRARIAVLPRQLQRAR